MRLVALALPAALAFGAIALFQAPAAQAPAAQPQFGKDNRLVRPQDYRDWVYLSSGLGMVYAAPQYGPQLFTNVFVAPAAYRQFLASGRWPEGTIFILEEREGLDKGSLTKSGRYQGDLVGLAAAVKDGKRFPDEWAYFRFDGNAGAAQPMPRTACWQCHNAHGAVDNTFVQFYPTLQGAARKFGAYDERKAGAP